MSKCTNCGKEFDGEICPECNTELVAGKKVCPQCGADMPSTARYCESCGAHLKGIVICSVCGTEDCDGNTYCEKCGAKIRSVNAKAGIKFLTVFGAVCVILSALTGVVFTFLCGFTLTVDYGQFSLTETQTIYYYFGDVYKEVDTLREAVKSQFGLSTLDTQREFAIVFPAVLGTAITVLGILGTVGLLAVTLWLVYKKSYKKVTANVLAPAVGSYMCFVAFSTILLAMSTAESDGMKVEFSGTTLAGLIIGGILCAIGVFSLALANSGNLKKSGSKIGVFITVTVVCISVVLLALLAQPAAGLKIKELNNQQLNSLGGDFGLFQIMQSMLLLIKKDELIYDMITFCSLGGVAGAAAIIIAAVIIFRKLSALTECENKSCFVLCLVCMVLSVFYLIGSIVALNNMVDFMNGLVNINITEYISKNVTMPIVVMAMSIVAAAVELLFKKRQNIYYGGIN